MTALNQEDIISNTKTVVQGLDTLRNEHNQILNSLLSSMQTIKEKNGETNLVEEKANILKKSIDMIDLGLGEAQVSAFICVRYLNGKGKTLRAPLRPPPSSPPFYTGRRNLLKVLNVKTTSSSCID